MKKKLIIFLGLTLCFSLGIISTTNAVTSDVPGTIPTFNSSQTNPPSISTEPIATERNPYYINYQKDLKTVITNGINMINARVTSLSDLRKQIIASNLTSTQKTNLATSTIASQINSLQTLAKKLKADTNITTAKNDAKAIYTNYRVYGVLIPKIDLIKKINIQQNFLNSLNTQFSQTQARIDRDKANCQNTDVRQKFLNYAKTVASAVNATLAANLNKVNSLTPASYPVASYQVITNSNYINKNVKAKLIVIQNYLIKANTSGKSVCYGNYTCDNGKCVNSSGICTGFQYSNWSTCSPDGLQTRTITVKTPTGCTGGSPASLIQKCTAPSTCNSTCDPTTYGTKCLSSSSATGVSTFITTCVKNADGCYYTSEHPCAAGQTCSNGTCVTPSSSSCTNQCNPYTTCTDDLKSVYGCAKDPFTGCYTYHTIQTCASGQQICRNGACISCVLSGQHPGDVELGGAASCCSGLVSKTDYYAGTANTCCSATQCAQDGVCRDNGTIIDSSYVLAPTCVNGSWLNQEQACLQWGQYKSPESAQKCCSNTVSPLYTKYDYWNSNYPGSTCCLIGECALGGKCVASGAYATGTGDYCLNGNWTGPTSGGSH